MNVPFVMTSVWLCNVIEMVGMHTENMAMEGEGGKRVGEGCKLRLSKKVRGRSKGVTTCMQQARKGACSNLAIIDTLII